MTHWNGNETPHDVANEERLATFVGRKFKCDMLREKRFAHFDYIAHRNERPVAVLELRKVRYSITQLTELMLPLSKLQEWQTLRGVTGLPCYFVVQFTDAVAYADLEDYAVEADFRISRKSKNRRGQDDHQEIIAMLPVEKFKVIYSGNLSVQENAT